MQADAPPLRRRAPPDLPIADPECPPRFGAVDTGLEVEGWYKDPNGRHELRWFSNGAATNSVRDGEVASHDEPPNETYGAALVPADEVVVANSSSTCRRRGDAGGGGTELRSDAAG